MKKFLLLSLIFFFLLISVPSKTNAQYTDIVNTTKEYGLDGFANAIAKITLKKLTAKTVNWINSGFKGNPAYIQNPRQFFLDIGDNVASDFLSQAGINQICSPFRAQVRLALVKNYISEEDNYSCTLDILQNNYEAFINDFSQGGWDGWFEITQNSQNNPYGSYLAAKNKLEIEIASQQGRIQKELDLSGGFLNYKRCPRGAEYTTASGERKCSVEEETVTPGVAINEQLSKALGTSWSQLEHADELDEIVTALVTQLVEQVAGRVGGLFGASEPQGGGASYTQQLDAEAQPAPTSGPITAVPPSINCNSTGGSGGSGGSGGAGDPNGVTGGGGGGGGTGGSAGCVSDPGSISGAPGWPGWPLGGGDPNDPNANIVAPADALARHPDQAGVVAQAKANVLAQGPIPPGGCGAFSIVQEAARLLGNGAGVLDKPTGENCGGYAVDIIMYPDGYIYDVLANGGLSNDPAWMPQPCIENGFTPLCPGRYRTAP